MSRDNRLDVYTKAGPIDAQFVVDSMDAFVQKLPQPAVVVIDNAKIHTCEKFMAKVEEWQERGLHIFHLPKYSPHLNLIETLWRKAKHEWLKVADYENRATLIAALDRIFAGFGTDYTIDFNELKSVE